ncbi:SH3 domain-containing protein [Cucumibacter marinus]|uniref:SH3 domain-containing protein n=1 Tax=Cucumibacter marinus TaxID=1121252 RepID=UPI0003F680F3|nr:SH3 domain-containing protein [Cucumibacter marinus]
MKLSKWLMAGILAFTGLLATAGAVYADQVTSTVPLNVRTGPGGGYSKVYVLYPGQVRETVGCSGGWCKFSDGYFASQSYLTLYNGGGGGGGGFEEEEDKPNVSITFGGPNFSVTFGSDGANVNVNVGQSCFYTGKNYTGQSFCIQGSGNRPKLQGWRNNNISSFYLAAGYKVRVCDKWNYNGGCIVYNSSHNQLPGPVDNAIGSLQVYK